jgi:hypothetical protein
VVYRALISLLMHWGFFLLVSVSMSASGASVSCSTHCMSGLAYVLPLILMHASLSSSPRLLPCAGALLQGGEDRGELCVVAGGVAAGAALGGLLGCRPSGRLFWLSRAEGDSSLDPGDTGEAWVVALCTRWGVPCRWSAARGGTLSAIHGKYCMMLVCLCLLSLVLLLAFFMALLVAGGASAPSILLAWWLPDAEASARWALVVIFCAGVVFVVAAVAADFVGASGAASSMVAWLRWGAPTVAISCSEEQRVLQIV